MGRKKDRISGSGQRANWAILGLAVAAGTGTLVPGAGAAQHCPFDGTAILVVDVRDAETQDKIKGLRLTIVDENGDPVSQKIQEEIGAEFKEALLVFCENPARTDPDWKPYAFKSIRYSFAKDNYVLPLARPYGAKTYLIKVEDVDGEANGAYQGATRAVKPEDYFDLHDNVGWPHIRDNPETLPPTQEFRHTIVIQLKRKGPLAAPG